jgi:hypothetical protein
LQSALAMQPTSKRTFQQSQKTQGRVAVAAAMFSLTDDFLGPGETCVKPIQITKKKRGAVDDGGPPAKASITLQDCLACSGCVTSAESVLITSQSAKEFETRVARTHAAGECDQWHCAGPL